VSACWTRRAPAALEYCQREWTGRQKHGEPFAGADAGSVGLAGSAGSVAGADAADADAGQPYGRQNHHARQRDAGQGQRKRACFATWWVSEHVSGPMPSKSSGRMAGKATSSRGTSCRAFPTTLSGRRRRRGDQPKAPHGKLEEPWKRERTRPRGHLLRCGPDLPPAIRR
jgi:hypothetical protein